MWKFITIFACYLSIIAAQMIEPIVLVHGGAGDIPTSREPGKIRGVKLAARMGYMKLIETGSALDAVEEAVRSMELDPYFNCGYGSVLTSNGTVEMDASIMDGTSMKAGCISLVKDILHPISLARRLIDKVPHNFIAGDGIMQFAKDQGIDIMTPSGQLVTDYAREALDDWFKQQESGGVKFARTEIGQSEKERVVGEVGTVGAVAIDRNGNIAVATSTGGITGKLPGRVGDTPILGSGTYADSRYGGVSTTGHGETIMKHCLAHDIIKRIDLLNDSAQKATQDSCDAMTSKLEGTGGAITIDHNGDVGIAFTSEKMAWAYQKENIMHYGILHDQHEQEIIEN